MKKLLTTLILIALFAFISAVTIETATGIKFKGDITKVIGDQFYIKTASGTYVVFRQEITKAISDAGFDVTEQILSRPSSIDSSLPNPDSNLPDNRTLLNQYKVIAYPLWAFVIVSATYYGYRMYRLNNPISPKIQIPQIPQTPE